MKITRLYGKLLGWGVALVMSLSLGACATVDSEAYQEKIDQEINRMIADGELIDVAAAEALDAELAALIEETDVSKVFEEGLAEAASEETEIPEKAEIPEFIMSDGPDTLEIDENKYEKIGTKYQPGEYVIVADEGESSIYFVVMDDEEHTTVVCGGNDSYEVFDTLNGQYIYVVDGKIYPISEAPEVKKTEEGAYPEGIYKAGVQIPPGEYVCKGDSVSLNTYVDLSREYESNLGYSSGTRSAIITVDEGQYIKAVWGDIYPIELTQDLKSKDGIYLDGMYKVGFHMPAGTYKLKADADTAYAEIFNDSYQISRADEVATAEPEATFTVTEGQYVRISGGEAVMQ